MLTLLQERKKTMEDKEVFALVRFVYNTSMDFSGITPSLSMNFPTIVAAVFSLYGSYVLIIPYPDEGKTCRKICLNNGLSLVMNSDARQRLKNMRRPDVLRALKLVRALENPRS